MHDGSSRKIGQIPISWDPDEDAAIARAHEQFKWFGGGWQVNSDLPTPAASRRRASSSGPRMSPSRSPADPDLDKIADAVKTYLDAGFTDVALVQVGDEKQEQFLAEAARPLLEKLRAL